MILVHMNAAPGDAQAKTKPSKHTKKFKKMFGEDAVAAARLKANQADETDRQKDKHEREVEKLKQKHEKENEKQKAEDEKEKENELMQKQREAQREEVELEEEGAADKSLKKKADKTGISVGILKQVYKRGVAAWRTGHRPGTTPEQWGHARVNSFITKGSGTWGKADKDLADKVRGESIEEGKLVTSYHDIIDLIQGKIKKKIEKEYEKSTEKGLKLINDLGAMIGHKATDKKQEKGKLFLKFGEEMMPGKGNVSDDGVCELGTDDIRKKYQADTPGQSEEAYIKETEKAFHEQQNRAKKNFKDVFGNPLKGYPANEEFEVLDK